MTSQAGNTKISVIVCTYNRANLLAGCLESLVNQTLDKALYEVIIVDNNCTDATPQIAEGFVSRHQNFRVVKEKKQGLSHARNRGWIEARGEYVAYLDDDAQATPEWCERILNAFATVHPKPVAVGGKILPRYETAPPKWFAEDLEIRTWGEEKGFLESKRAPYGFSGSNMALPKHILKKYGGFSPEYGMVGNKVRVGDETELFLRIYQDYPYFWYDPEIIVHHWVPRQKMTVMYCVRRAFHCGLSSAKLRGNKISYFRYYKSMIKIGFDFLLIPFHLPWFSAQRTQILVQKVMKLASRFGYLQGGKS